MVDTGITETFARCRMSTRIPPRVRQALEEARAAKLARTAPDEAFSDLVTHEVNDEWLASPLALNSIYRAFIYPANFVRINFDLN